jgi:nitronate monooxygenase
MVDLRETGAAIPPYPIQNALTRRLRAEAAKRGLTDFMSMWVGQGARLARPLPAAELVSLLAAETATSLRRFA